MAVKTQEKKTTLKKKSTSKKTDWPKRTDVLFRPDRYRYVKEEKPKGPKECVFCVTAQAQVSFETLCLYKNKLAQVVMNW